MKFFLNVFFIFMMAVLLCHSKNPFEHVYKQIDMDQHHTVYNRV